VDARTSSGRLFQTAGAAAAKARSPIVERWYSEEVVKRNLLLIRRTSVQSLCVYKKPQPLTAISSKFTTQ